MASKEDQSRKSHSIQVNMMRAFVSLARTLNLTETCEELGATRQTVRRHIRELEDLFGNQLLEVRDRAYHLTPFGKSRLSKAIEILRVLDNWTMMDSLNHTEVSGLEHTRFRDDEGREFFSQQHPVSMINRKAVPLLREALEAWGKAGARIDHPAFEPFRDYQLLYRRTRIGWVFSEVGEKSAYARWFGSDWAKSANGQLMEDDELADDFNAFISAPYTKIFNEGGIRLDHIYAHLSHEGGPLIPGSFQRLLLGCSFPDGSLGLSVLVAITRQVDIAALQERHINQTPAHFIMDNETVHP